MYAVIETGGKQFRVEEGRYIHVELLAGEPGDSVELKEVLLVNTDSETKVGSPYVQGAKVVGKIMAHGKDKKIDVFRYKRKKAFRKRYGHRQPFTRLMIEKIAV